jgi:Spy/CpxP family protein refolding chaperone
MRRRLDLSDDQVTKIEAILREAEGWREKSLEPCRGSLDETRAKQDGQILEILNPEQQAQYREFVERKRKSRKRN